MGCPFAVPTCEGVRVRVALYGACVKHHSGPVRCLCQASHTPAARVITPQQFALLRADMSEAPPAAMALQDHSSGKLQQQLGIGLALTLPGEARGTAPCSVPRELLTLSIPSSRDTSWKSCQNAGSGRGGAVCQEGFESQATLEQAALAAGARPGTQAKFCNLHGKACLDLGRDPLHTLTYLPPFSILQTPTYVPPLLLPGLWGETPKSHQALSI